MKTTTKRKPSTVRATKPKPEPTRDIFAIWFAEGKPEIKLLRIDVDEHWAIGFCNGYNGDGSSPLAIMLPSGLWRKAAQKKAGAK